MDTQNKKYELTNDTINHRGRTLHRIKALRYIPCHNIKAGDLGGYIEKEDNLSQTGDCWVGDKALVYDNAQVCDNAIVSGDAKVYGNAKVCGKAILSGYVRINTGVRNGESTTDAEPEAKTKDSNEIVLANIVLSNGKLGLRSNQKDIDTQALLKQLLT